MEEFLWHSLFKKKWPRGLLLRSIATNDVDYPSWFNISSMSNTSLLFLVSSFPYFFLNFRHLYCIIYKNRKCFCAETGRGCRCGPSRSAGNAENPRAVRFGRTARRPDLLLPAKVLPEGLGIALSIVDTRETRWPSVEIGRRRRTSETVSAQRRRIRPIVSSLRRNFREIPTIGPLQQPFGGRPRWHFVCWSSIE